MIESSSDSDLIQQEQRTINQESRLSDLEYADLSSFVEYERNYAGRIRDLIQQISTSELPSVQNTQNDSISVPQMQSAAQSPSRENNHNEHSSRNENSSRNGNSASPIIDSPYPSNMAQDLLAEEDDSPFLAQLNAIPSSSAIETISGHTNSIQPSMTASLISSEPSRDVSSREVQVSASAANRSMANRSQGILEPRRKGNEGSTATNVENSETALNGNGVHSIDEKNTVQANGIFSNNSSEQPQQDASKEIANKMLQGWTLLADHCTRWVWSSWQSHADSRYAPLWVHSVLPIKLRSETSNSRGIASCSWLHNHLLDAATRAWPP